MGTFVVSGSASGMGKATADLLSSQGHQVVGIDLNGADVNADLATAEGRALALASITLDRLDGAALFAGLAGATGRPASLLASVNYFGSVALFEGLKPLLGPGSAALAVCSNSMTVQPGWSEELVAACLAGDEDHARIVADAGDSPTAYPATKVALARWLRRAAPAWAADGVRLNAIAPGLIETPLVAETRADPVLGSLVDAFPLPLGRGGRPEEIAELAVFLLTRAPYMVGSIVLCDGGSEALLRPDAYPTRWEF